MTSIELDIDNKVAWVRVSSHPKFNDLLFSDDIWKKLMLRPDTTIQVWFRSKSGVYEFARHPKPETKPETKPEEPFRVKGKCQDYSYDFEPFSWLPASERREAYRKSMNDLFNRHQKEMEERTKKRRDRIEKAKSKKSK